MIDGLERFVELDVPFLIGERTERVASLKDLLERSDVTAAEKFRVVMEAWQIENDYARTIYTYTDDLDIGGVTREVDVLQVGRVALLYQTADGAQSGAWDQRTRQWVPVGNEYRNPTPSAKAYGWRATRWLQTCCSCPSPLRRKAHEDP